MEVRPLHSHALRRLGDVVAAAIESGQQESPLQVFADLPLAESQLLPCAGHFHRGGRRLGLADFPRQAGELDSGASVKHGHPFDDVPQLADVARPGMQFQLVHRLGGETDHVGVHLPREMLEEGDCQQGNVPVAIAQWREPNRHDIQTVVEIGAERAGFDQFRQVAIARGDQPDIDRAFDRIAHLAHLACLQNAEQLPLRLQA